MTVINYNWITITIVIDACLNRCNMFRLLTSCSTHWYHDPNCRLYTQPSSTKCQQLQLWLQWRFQLDDDHLRVIICLTCLFTLWKGLRFDAPLKALSSSVWSLGLTAGCSCGSFTGGSSSMIRIRRMTPLSCHSYMPISYMSMTCTMHFNHWNTIFIYNYRKTKKYNKTRACCSKSVSIFQKFFVCFGWHIIGHFGYDIFTNRSTGAKTLFNPLKHSGIKWLHFEVLSAIQV